MKEPVLEQMPWTFILEETDFQIQLDPGDNEVGEDKEATGGAD